MVPDQRGKVPVPAADSEDAPRQLKRKEWITLEKGWAANANPAVAQEKGNATGAEVCSAVKKIRINAVK